MATEDGSARREVGDPSAKARVDNPDDDAPDRVVVVEVELPRDVAEAARDEDGNINPDKVSDRLQVLPTVDGEPV